jgi:hypothetical protein
MAVREGWDTLEPGALLIVQKKGQQKEIRQAIESQLVTSAGCIICSTSIDQLK